MTHLLPKVYVKYSNMFSFAGLGAFNVLNSNDGIGYTDSDISKMKNVKGEKKLDEILINLLDKDIKKFIKNKTIPIISSSGFLEIGNYLKTKKEIHLINNFEYSIRKFKRTLKIEGPCLSVSNACSSGGNSLIIAAQFIEMGIYDNVLVVAYEIDNIIPCYGMDRIGALAKGKIKPFDKFRDGTVLAEGFGLVLLSSIPSMVRISGYGITSDGYNITMPHPQGLYLRKAIENAINMAKIKRSEIEYINAHGSGTVLNDKIETKVIKEVFGNNAYKIIINSSKSIIGHTLGAAGLLEAIISIESLEYSTIHKTMNHENTDMDCDLYYNDVNKIQSMKLKNVLSISIGFGGVNTAIIFSKEEVRMSKEEIIKLFREYLFKFYIFGIDEIDFDNNASLIQGGFLDSTGIIEIVAFIEHQFNVKVNDDELLPNNFDSINMLSDYVVRKTQNENL